MMHKEKVDLRKKILALRNAMTVEEHKRADFLIAEKVLGHNWFQTSKKLLVYVSIGSEVDTRMIIEEAFRQKKQVFVPKVQGEELSFYRISSFEELEVGFKGIMEPVSGLPEYDYQCEQDRNTLVLMPGVAFDTRRNRIGYGKGYYDRYLQDKQGLRKMALSYECQIVEVFEAQPHDVKPDVIITQAQKKGGFGE